MADLTAQDVVTALVGLTSAITLLAQQFAQVRNRKVIRSVNKAELAPVKARLRRLERTLGMSTELEDETEALREEPTGKFPVVKAPPR